MTVFFEIPFSSVLFCSLNFRPRVIRLILSAKDNDHVARVLLKEGRSASLPVNDEGAKDTNGNSDRLAQNSTLRQDNKAARLASKSDVTDKAANTGRRSSGSSGAQGSDSKSNLSPPSKAES
eukprot:2578933-Amphidinium_carterae.1